MKKNLLAVIMCMFMIFGFVACGENSGGTGSTNNEEAKVEENVDNTVAEVEVKNEELPGGTYLVGEDISAGKYKITYKTEMSEDDYWGNDYFWITRAGSEGTEETLGGTKYDESIGGFEYGAASQGKTSFVNLKDGDTIVVDSEEGIWTY